MKSIPHVQGKPQAAVRPLSTRGKVAGRQKGYKVAPMDFSRWRATGWSSGSKVHADARASCMSCGIDVIASSAQGRHAAGAAHFMSLIIHGDQ